MTNRCTICQQKLGKIVLTILTPDRFEKSIGIANKDYMREWLQCEGCGCLANILPPAYSKKIDTLRERYYEIDFADGDIGEKYRFVMSLPPENSDNVGRVNRIFNFLRFWFSDSEFQKLSILDIGAGTGVFLSKLGEISAGLPWKFVGIEPDPMAAKHLKGLAKFQVYEGLFEGQNQFQDFNLFTLNKVLEHIPNPMDLLKNIRKAMNGKSSVLYIEVPDKITAEIAIPSDNILGPLHCHLYGFQTISYIASCMNFELLSVQRIKEPSGKLTIFAFLTLPEYLKSSWRVGSE